MRILFKDAVVVIIPDGEEDDRTVRSWAAERRDHVFGVEAHAGAQVVLRDLGPRADACREPINIGLWVPDEQLRLISNLAHTPFVLDGRRYESVEAFWQGFKFPSAADRRRVALLDGHAARRAGQEAQPSDTFVYEGETYRVGTFSHWTLMHRACAAKFGQHAEAQAALLSTGSRPLEHRVRRDSRNIPGVIMADIWMRIRARLADGTLG